MFINWMEIDKKKDKTSNFPRILARTSHEEINCKINC